MISSTSMMCFMAANDPQENYGRDARSAFEKHKHALGVKQHSGDYHLKDADDLKTQHEKLYPTQA